MWPFSCKETCIIRTVYRADSPVPVPKDPYEHWDDCFLKYMDTQYGYITSNACTVEAFRKVKYSGRKVKTGGDTLYEILDSIYDRSSLKDRQEVKWVNKDNLVFPERD